MLTVPLINTYYMPKTGLCLTAFSQAPQKTETTNKQNLKLRIKKLLESEGLPSTTQHLPTPRFTWPIYSSLLSLP